jgi:hypothetical protein
MPYPEQPFGGLSTPIAFPITKSDGEDESEFYVGDGVCYSTYSLETGSFLNIEGLNKNFNWGKDEKIYIEIEVGLNLGIKNAKLKHAAVGEDGPDDGWRNYPYFYKIEPEDTFEDGKVTKIRDGKRQTKCYVLIGYLQDDGNKNGDEKKKDEENEEENGGDGEGEGEEENTENVYVPVQILRENVLLVQSVVSGIPCLAPFPYFIGGLTHILAIKRDLGEEEE